MYEGLYGAGAGQRQASHNFAIFQVHAAAVLTRASISTRNMRDELNEAGKLHQNPLGADISSNSAATANFATTHRP